MENMLDKALKVARSDTVKASGKTSLKHIFYIPIGIMKKQINLNRKICSHLQRL